MILYRRNHETFEAGEGAVCVLPANRFLRIGMYPLSLPARLCGRDIQQKLNLLSEAGTVELWQPVRCGRLILVPGEPAPSMLDLRGLYRAIRALIPSDTVRCHICPVTVFWGFPPGEEISAVSECFSDADIAVEAVLENRHSLRFENSFFNPLMRELSTMRKEGSDDMSLARHARLRAMESGIDCNLLLYCLGLPQADSCQS
ncbi:MAG: hypothetical protein IJ523_00110 [Succinivibrionaceae bacterium]|nr:hypothetical protein [Succinivibrionaceae bacterium]